MFDCQGVGFRTIGTKALDEIQLGNHPHEPNLKKAREI